MDINSATASTIPGLVQDWNPQSTSQDVAQCFISNSDQASRLFSNFLKANPIYKRLTMADRCSTFFQCAIRLSRIFKAAPAAMSRNNFHPFANSVSRFPGTFLFCIFLQLLLCRFLKGFVSRAIRWFNSSNSTFTNLFSWPICFAFLEWEDTIHLKILNRSNNALKKRKGFSICTTTVPVSNLS